MMMCRTPFLLFTLVMMGIVWVSHVKATDACSQLAESEQDMTSLKKKHAVTEIFVGAPSSSSSTTTTSTATSRSRRKDVVILNDGSYEYPFSSLYQVKRALRNGLGRNTTRIIRVTGQLLLSSRKKNKPLRFTSKDSGTADHPIIFTSHDQTKPSSLLGGIRIPRKSWKKYHRNNDNNNNTNTNTNTNIYVADLFALGLQKSDFGKLANPHPQSKLELFYNGKPAILARDPNIIAGSNDIIDKRTWVGYENMTIISPNNTSFYFNDVDSAKLWKMAIKKKEEDKNKNNNGNDDDNDDGVWLHGYYGNDWRDTYIKLESITKMNDTTYVVTRDIQTPPQYPIKSGCRFYAVNSLVFLDSPGEYYISNSDGKIYFYPPTPHGIVLGDTFVSVNEQIITSVGASYISFVNLIISMSRGGAVSISKANNLHFCNCTISNAGGACMSLAQSSSNSSIVDSFMFGCGSGGIHIDGGNIQTLEPSNISIVGNTLYDFSRQIRTYTPAIGFNGCGHYVANNTLSRAPHTAIAGGGVNNMFEFNVIKNVCYETVDVGAFYTGRSWAQRGNVARYNVFANVRATERLSQKSSHQNAFYMDDEMSGWDVYGNVFMNATQGVLLGGGRDNTIHNNLFWHNDKDIQFDNRGMDWNSVSCYFNCSDVLGNSCFRVALEEINYQNPPYSIEYPELVDIYQNHPCVPVGNVIVDNTYCHANKSIGVKESIFLDQNASTIHSWFSRSSNNIQDCSKDPYEWLLHKSQERQGYILGANVDESLL